MVPFSLYLMHTSGMALLNLFSLSDIIKGCINQLHFKSVFTLVQGFFSHLSVESSSSSSSLQDSNLVKEVSED